MNHTAIVSDLGRVPIFSELSEEQRGYLADQLQTRVYAPGERIFEQGSTGDELHVVLDGTTSLRSRGPDGHEHAVSTLGRGQSFGEIGFLTGRPRSLSAVNGENAGTHLVLSRFDFDRVAALTPDIGLAVFERVLALITARMEALPADERNFLMWGYEPAVPRESGHRALRVATCAGALTAVVTAWLSGAAVALGAGLLVATATLWMERDRADTVV